MLLIRNGLLYTMESDHPIHADLLIRNGQFAEIGQDILPTDGMQVIDAREMHIVPGFIDAHSHIGLSQEKTTATGDTSNEATAPTTPCMRAIDAINPMDSAFHNALAAGITEEFLFRGAVQRVIGGWTRNHHIIIWSAAILFSAFHMQFFGFLPRMLLGAYFGYLLYWGRNIWIPVFAHFTNNAFAVISMSDAKLKDNEFITGDISAQNLLPYTVIAIISLFLFYACAKKIKQLTAAKN